MSAAKSRREGGPQEATSVPDPPVLGLMRFARTQADRPPFARTRPHNPLAARLSFIGKPSASLKATPIDPKNLTRYGNTVGASYLAASRDARAFFARFLAQSGPLTPGRFGALTDGMHRHMAYKDRDNAGVRRTGADKFPAPPRGKALRYVERLDAELGLGFGERYAKRPEARRIAIDGIPAEAAPEQRSSAHVYPAGDDLPAYFTRGAELLESIRVGLEAGDDAESIRDRIGVYYHVMVNARPYESVNNSMFMNQVNELLKRTGHPGLMHGDLDFAFMLIDSDSAATLWSHVIAGRVPTYAALTGGDHIDPAMRPESV